MRRVGVHKLRKPQAIANAMGIENSHADWFNTRFVLLESWNSAFLSGGHQCRQKQVYGVLERLVSTDYIIWTSATREDLQ
jgi:hypothetical protein